MFVYVEMIYDHVLLSNVHVAILLIIYFHEFHIINLTRILLFNYKGIYPFARSGSLFPQMERLWKGKRLLLNHDYSVTCWKSTSAEVEICTSKAMDNKNEKSP